MVIWVVAELPARSTATAWIVLLPIFRGTFVARKVRLATCEAIPLTVTCACWLFTVPTTMSFTFPAIENEAAVVLTEIERVTESQVRRARGVRAAETERGER